MDTRFAAVILAGGKSSRMGQDKAQMLRPDGLTQLEHTQAQVALLNPSFIMVSGSPDLPDVYPELGPLSGIHAAIEKLNAGDSLLVVPCDLPLLTSDALAPLLSSTESTAYKDSFLPCLLQVTESLKQHLNSILENNKFIEKSNFSIKKLLNFCNVGWKENHHKKSTESANTIEIWNKLTANIK
jgi:molybdopterin-guanine dinucleotide biosynthesis protein A